MTAPDTGMNFGELFNKHGGEAEILPPGNYDVVVEEASTKSSKDGSKPQVVIKFKIVDHPKFSNRKITNTFTVSTQSEMAMSIFFRQMAALGFGGDFWAQNPNNPLPTLAAQAVGRRARIGVKHETYQNVDRPKVANVMPGAAAAGVGGLPPAPGGGGFAAPPPAPQIPAAPPVAPAPAPAAASAPAAAQVPPVQELIKPAAPAPAPEPAPAAPAPVAEQPAPAAPAPAQEQAPVPAGVGGPPPAVPF